MRRGYFVTFEGAEGSGKSTQIQRAAAYLRKRGKRVILLREPGGTRVSEAIRNIILNKKLKEMTPETELLLYLAARAQIVREKIEPALRKGQVVICDRFEDSTLAYQGFGRGISMRTIELLGRFVCDVRARSPRPGQGGATPPLRPDLTILLDIHPRLGLKRGGRHDRIERESLAFHNRVRRGFLVLARKNPRRFRILDATKSKNEISRKIAEILKKRIR